MTERKGSDDRKVIKISSDLHQAIDIESAVSRVPMYVLIERAWELYQGKSLQVDKDQQAEIEAGLSPRQVKLVKRYADLLRSGRDPEFARVIETMLDRAEHVAQPEHDRKAG